VVTILFCDVKGSTAMAEHLDPEEWAEIMNAAFSYLIQPVQRYEGTVARLMGDAILAFFGAPIAHEDDPQRAVLAGLDIVEGIRPYCEQLRSEYGLDFNVRVGINTGVVVVGEVGTALAGEYTAMGDAVNLAARMEQTAQPGSVQISGETYRLVSAFFEVEALGVVEVKGKSDGVPAYRVLKRKERPERGRGIVGLESPLVGRTREVQSLRQALEDMKSGRGQIVTLIGEAGLGKSRLIEELRANSNGDSTQQIESRDHTHPNHAPAVHWVESRGISYEASRPYGLFTQHLRHICEVKENDPPDLVRSKVAAAMTDLDLDTRAAVSRIAELLLVMRAVPDSSAAPLEGEALKREIFDSALAMWRSFAGLVPLVLVFDDCTGPTRLRWSCCSTYSSLPIKCRSCSCAPFAPTAARQPGASRPPPKRTTLTATPRSPFPRCRFPKAENWSITCSRFPTCPKSCASWCCANPRAIPSSWRRWCGC